MKTRWIGALLSLPIAVLGSEAAYRIAQTSAQSYPSGNCLVLALGAPSRADGTTSALQCFRVEAAAWQGAAFLRDRLQFERNARANGRLCGQRPPISSSHPHLELDEHFESIEEASAMVCQQATAALRRRLMSLLQIALKEPLLHLT